MGRKSSAPAGPRHTPARVLGRLAIGKHWHGRALSDATFFRNGTQGQPGWFGAGRESRWVLAAGWKRVAVRLVLVAVAAGLVCWRGGTLWILGLAGGPLAGLGLVRLVRAVRLRWHRGSLERPLSAALAPYLGIPPRSVEDALSVRPDFEDAEGLEHVGALVLPDDWAATGGQRATVQEVIGARFGIGLDYHWRTTDYPMVVNFTRSPVPPTMVRLADVLDQLAARPAHKVLLGLDAAGTMRAWDRSQEDPHVLTSGGSRRGKTSLLLSVAAQELAAGGRVTAIDPKFIGLTALAKVPGCTVLSDPRDLHAMWSAVEAFRLVIEDRFEALSHDPTLEFPAELLIVDEVSLFAALSARLWRVEKAKSDPALAPVWDDIAMSVFTGAQANARVFVAGQRIDFNTLGGTIGSYGVRLLAGYTAQDYARLVGVSPFLRSQKPRGRFLLYEGGETTWLQLIFGDPEEWADYALGAIARRAAGAPDLAGGVAGATGDMLIGLAAGAAYLGVSVDAFRKRLERYGRPPGEARIGNQPAWSGADLGAWAGRAGAETS